MRPAIQANHGWCVWPIASDMSQAKESSCGKSCLSSALIERLAICLRSGDLPRLAGLARLLEADVSSEIALGGQRLVRAASDGNLLECVKTLVHLAILSESLQPAGVRSQNFGRFS